MPAKLKLSEAEVKTIRRRLHAGARRKELADAYGVNRKTIQRRVNALELAERGRQSDVEGKPAPGPEPAPTSSLAGPSSSQQERADAGRPGSARGGASGGRIDRFRPGTYEHWLDERDARVPAPPDPRVRLVTESGKTVGSTCESNAERMAVALAARHGPLRVVPA